MQSRKKTVLFVCTGNSCRSQMAEAILRHQAGDRFVALSGGSRPAGFVHPLALETLERLQIPVDGLESKHIEELAGLPIDICLTLCDSASAECPAWPPSTIQVHWGLPDPAYYQGTAEERLAFCSEIAQRLIDRLGQLARLDMDVIPRAELAERLGRMA